MQRNAVKENSVAWISGTAAGKLIYIFKLIIIYIEVFESMDQFVVLTIIGALILILGIALFVGKKRGGGLLVLIGALWLLTMALYYGLSYAGIYGTPHPLNNVIGVIILVAGLGITLQYLRKRAGKPSRGEGK